jgi:GNAT superfamily N-acetyltransferase
LPDHPDAAVPIGRKNGRSFIDVFSRCVYAAREPSRRSGDQCAVCTDSGRTSRRSADYRARPSRSRDIRARERLGTSRKIAGSNVLSAHASPACEFTVEPLTERHLDAFRALFEASSAPCFCRYWHFSGTKNDWLERCASRPDENFEEQADAVRRGDISARGLVAIEPPSGRVVGWMKLSPESALPKLSALPVYRNVPSPEGTWKIGCFLVQPERRRRGISTALLRAASTYVRAWGGRFIEGYPRRASHPLHDEEAWQGPESLFIEFGFRAIHDVAPYPIYRKIVAQDADAVAL